MVALTPHTINTMKVCANTLLERAPARAESMCPLTEEDVNNIRIPTRIQRLLEELKGAGVTPSYTYRACIKLCVFGRELVFGTMFKGPDIRMDCSNWDRLDEAKHKMALVWAEDVLRKRRLAKMAVNTITSFLDINNLSTGHVKTRWPGLGCLMLGSVGSAGWRLGVPAGVKAAFESAKPSQSRYGWANDGAALYWYQNHKTQMAAVDILLAQASMLSSEAPTVYMRLQTWSKLPGDLD